jgi:hypothetical protein
MVTVFLLLVSLTLQGLPWPFALLFIALMLIMFTVCARISAEAGVPHIETNWNALTVMSGLFGAAALGPVALLAVGILSAMLMVDARECLMPFVVNGLKLGEEEGVKPAGICVRGFGVFVAGFILAIPVVLAAVYTCGAPLADRWGCEWVPKWPFSQLNKALYSLQATGELAGSESCSTFGRFLTMAPESGFLWAAAIGAALVLVCNALRFRLPWWPIHPILFLTWTTWPMMNFCQSFLLGWLAKNTIMRFGGQRLFQQTLPFMIGVIAGDLLGGLLFMIVGAFHFAATGTPAPPFRVFLG